MSSHFEERGKPTPVSEIDYLDEDQPIRGQNYAVISFISPEDVLKQKDIFVLEKFMKNMTTELRELFENLMVEYPDDKDKFKSLTEKYKYLFVDGAMQEEFNYFRKEKDYDITQEFNEKVEFQTNVRGFKIRGSYDTHREAEIRSEILKRKDGNKYNIYIAQVGCWCPWNPNPDDITNQQYADDKLNTLMEEYNKNQQSKDEVFNERKEELIEAQKERNRRVEELNKIAEEKAKLEEATKEEVDVDALENEVISTTGIGGSDRVVENVNEETPRAETDKLQDEDPWMKRLKEREEIKIE